MLISPQNVMCFCLLVTRGLWGLSFPVKRLNLGPGSESTKAPSLNRQNTREFQKNLVLTLSWECLKVWVFWEEMGKWCVKERNSHLLQ